MAYRARGMLAVISLLGAAPTLLNMKYVAGLPMKPPRESPKAREKLRAIAHKDNDEPPPGTVEVLLFFPMYSVYAISDVL
jgi:hypothetical protein